MKSIRVLLVDDHRMVLEGLRVLLEPLPDIVVAGTCTTAAEAYAAVAANAPDVALLDLNLPDQHGTEVCQQLLATYPSLKIVALTTLNERSYVVRMMQCGAMGYVLKNASPEELSEAIRRACAGQKYFSEQVQEMLLDALPAPPARPPLTRREKEILALIARGLTSQEMADQLFLSVLTVETHRRNMLTKFGVSNTAALIHLASQQGLL